MNSHVAPRINDASGVRTEAAPGRSGTAIARYERRGNGRWRARLVEAAAARERTGVRTEPQAAVRSTLPEAEAMVPARVRAAGAEHRVRRVEPLAAVGEPVRLRVAGRRRLVHGAEGAVAGDEAAGVVPPAPLLRPAEAAVREVLVQVERAVGPRVLAGRSLAEVEERADIVGVDGRPLPDHSTSPSGA